MSWWTYVTGVITVDVSGRTQKQKEYILDMVLRHLPKVTGSEHDMETYITPREGHNISSNFNEFDVHIYDYPHDMSLQSTYLITVCGSLRDRVYSQTYREVVRWLTRLSKRLIVDDVLVKVFDHYGNESVITNDNDVFGNMYELGSWAEESHGIPNWTEFMLWDIDGIDSYPLELLAREGDERAQQEIARRHKWMEENREGAE